jgi:hypothetical protein
VICPNKPIPKLALIDRKAIRWVTAQSSTNYVVDGNGYSYRVSKEKVIFLDDEAKMICDLEGIEKAIEHMLKVN